MDALVSQVDQFLLEALENPRHRLTVLRMELDIQRFMQNSDLHQFEFQHFPTSYLRCAAHRVAQHYGLQTMVADSTLDGLGGRIIARKTSESRFPAVSLSDIPAKQTENEKTERFKIAIRQKPNKVFQGDASELETNRNLVRTVEERKEEYDKARARIFSGSSSSDSEGPTSPVANDGLNHNASKDELECYKTIIDEHEKLGMKVGAPRVAIFRDREKDRSDPDYDRSYDRYVRGLAPGQTFSLAACNVPPAPFFPYEAGFAQLGQFPRNQTPMNYGPPDSNLNPYCAVGCQQTPRDAVYMQWPTPAMMYAHSYEHFRHGIFQAPFYQQPLSFDHMRNH